jgi:putative transposase
MVEPGHPHISVRRQCELVGWSRAALDYEPRPESTENLRLMRLLDEPYTRTPDYGSRRMAAWLRTQGYQVHHTRVQRRLRRMGLEASDPKPHLSRLGAGQQL